MYNIYTYIYVIYKHEVFSACLLQTQIFSDQHFYGTVMKTLWYTGVAGIIDWELLIYKMGEVTE